MTKEELEKEAEEYASMYARQYLHNDGSGLTNSYCEVYNAYYQSAEPREKRIAKLESQNKELKKWLKEKFESCASKNLSFVAKYDTACQELDSSKAKIAELEKENAELNFKLKQAVKILKECAEYEDLTCYSDILEEIETFLKSVDKIKS